MGLLIEENKSLRLKLQSSIRSQARLQGTTTELGNALRDHEQRAYARELAKVRRNEGEQAVANAMETKQTVGPLQGGRSGDSPNRLACPSGGSFVRRYCACSEKLQELLDFIDSQIGNYERGVWQTQVNVLEEERDSLMLK